MRKRLLPALAVLLLAAALWTYFTRKSGTFSEELRDFAVKDTARITRIFLSDRSGNSVLLDRSAGNVWKVNDSINAKGETIRQLLEVIYRVDVRTRVPRSRYNTVIKDLAARGIKCEIYLDHRDDPTKTYYVGGQTEDALGTYMLLENSSVPFVTEIPGFNGYLTPWYPVRLKDWKDNVVFSYRPDDIITVDVDYPSMRQHSFILRRTDTGFTVSHEGKTIPVISVADTVALSNYLAMLRFVPYEDTDKLIADSLKDSIRSTTPAVRYSITDRSGTVNSILLHPMPLNDYSLTREDSTGAPLKYDVDRMLGWLEREGQWVTVQHYTFDPILRRYADFATIGGKSTALPR